MISVGLGLYCFLNVNPCKAQIEITCLQDFGTWKLNYNKFHVLKNTTLF